MRLVIAETGEELAAEIRTAYRFWQRFMGLMFTKNLPQGTGLHLKPCPSIHTCGMNYAIDVLYLGMDYQVVGMQHALRPWRAGERVSGAASVVELPAGTLARTRIQSGDYIQFEP